MVSTASPLFTGAARPHVQPKPCEHRGFVVAFPWYRCVRCHGLFKREAP